MKIGLNQSGEALGGLEQWQKQISNNIASSQTPGYKQGSVAFEGAESPVSTAKVNQEDNSVQGSIPEVTSKISFIQGAVQQTGVHTDLAIQGDGFFELTNKDGQKIYTRSGQFHFNAENTLVDPNGFVVSGNGGPITQDASGGPLTINRSGDIIQNGQAVGKVGVFTVANKDGLTPVQGGFALPEGENANLGAEDSQVIQGHIEGSNVSPVEQMVNLIRVSRAYEANQKVISQIDAQYGRAIEYLGTA